MARPLLQVRIEGPDGRMLQGQILQHHGRMMRYRTEMWEAVGMYTRAAALGRQFHEEGAYLGERWQGNSPGYREWKTQVWGSPARRVGRRTGALHYALAGTELQAQTYQGQTRDGESTTIQATPRLDVDDHGVTVGGSVEEDGQEYSERFNERRPILGQGKLPPDVEGEIGKLLTLFYVAASHPRELARGHAPPIAQSRRYIRRVAGGTLDELLG